MNGFKITGLTRMNCLAIREAFPLEDEVSVTATTATWKRYDAAEALQRLDTAMSVMPTNGHPRHSLHAVRRKLVRRLVTS
jgi:hypothetical protein